jgi:acyl carrier protein
VVVAANVLHDARDLAWSLRQLHRILAPGGVLIAIEGTANSRIQMVSVGFIEGFSHHQGDRAMPLLPVDAWRDQLAAAGFAPFASWPAGAPVARAMVQHVLLGARSPDDVAARSGDVSPALDPGTLRETLERTLPGYMVPQHYMVIGEWPLNANGKVDRPALPAPWSGPAAPRRTEPRDRAEQTLLQIWREVLGREDIGVADNFFELGGDSLHAVRIFGRLREELGVRQSADEAMQALFECPTVAGFATVLNARQAPS